MGKKFSKKKHKNNPSKKSKAADKQLQETSTQEMINAMNYMLSVLHGRGVKILNWDNKDKELGLIKMFKCKPYYMEGNIEPEEVCKDELDGHNDNSNN